MQLVTLKTSFVVNAGFSRKRASPGTSMNGTKTAQYG